MNKTIALLLVGASWLGIAGCQPEPEVDGPVAEGLPQNESRPQERRVAEGLLREDRDSDSDSTPAPVRPAPETPDTTEQ